MHDKASKGVSLANRALKRKGYMSGTDYRLQKGGEDAARAIGAQFEYKFAPSGDMADMAIIEFVDRDENAKGAVDRKRIDELESAESAETSE